MTNVTFAYVGSRNGFARLEVGLPVKAVVDHFEGGAAFAEDTRINVLGMRDDFADKSRPHVRVEFTVGSSGVTCVEGADYA